MPQGLESGTAATNASVDPLLLAIVLFIFVIGAVVPLAAAIISSVREDRAAKRAQAQVVTNPVADNVVIAVDMVELEPVGADTLSAAANDDGYESASGGAG